MELSEFLKADAASLSRRSIVGLILRLGIPAILAQLAAVAMQYIDAVMVGALGATATASVGIVISSTWIAIGLVHAVAMGFSVQVAHALGAENHLLARTVFRKGALSCLLFSGVLSILCTQLSTPLPRLLGAQESLWNGASSYFFIYACSLPAVQLRIFSGAILQCSGDTKTPSFLNALLCLFDIVLNFFLIFPGHTFTIGTLSIGLPGTHLGVVGAALGTALSEGIIAVAMFGKVIRLPSFRTKASLAAPSQTVMKTAVKISVPMAVESVAKEGAHLLLTGLIAPLGAVALAANTLAFTIEQLCYLPGLGLSIAATTLVGQALGAGQKDLALRFARLSILCGVFMVTTVASMLYGFAPTMFSFFTRDSAVQDLGVRILRIVLMTEPLIAVSVVTVGALRGAKDTLSPCLIVLLCKWGIVLPLSIFWVKDHGVVGIWTAMAVEFCARGTLFSLWFRNSKRWLNRGEPE